MILFFVLAVLLLICVAFAFVLLKRIVHLNLENGYEDLTAQSRGKLKNTKEFPSSNYNVDEVFTDEEISKLLPVGSTNQWALDKVIHQFRIWQRTFTSSTGANAKLSSLTLRVKSSSQNLVNFIGRVSSLKEWKAGIGDVEIVNSVEGEAVDSHLVRWRQKRLQYSILPHYSIFTEDNVISWCLEPLLDTEYTVTRFIRRESKFPRVCERFVHSGEFTIFLCQPIIGLENDQCRLTAITSARVDKLAEECTSILEHFALHRAPVKTSQALPVSHGQPGSDDEQVMPADGVELTEDGGKVGVSQAAAPSATRDSDKPVSSQQFSDGGNECSKSDSSSHSTNSQTADQSGESVEVSGREEKVQGYGNVLFLRTLSSETGHVDYKTLSNTCAAEVLAEVLNATNLVQKQKGEKGGGGDSAPVIGWVVLLRDLAESEEGHYQLSHNCSEYCFQFPCRKFENTDRSVAIMQKYSQHPTTYQSWLGKGLIKERPEVVWQTIVNPYSRYIYDDMLKDLTVISDLGDGMKLLRLFYSTNQVLRKDCREFYLLQAQRVTEKKRILTFCSFDYPESESKECPRGKFAASGWIVEPIVSKNRNTYSIVTYLSQIDLCDGTTSSVQQLEEEFVTKQPSAIASIRDYLTALTLN